MSKYDHNSYVHTYSRNTLSCCVDFLYSLSLFVCTTCSSVEHYTDTYGIA